MSIDPSQDRSLPEHPAEIRARLKAAGEWEAAKRVYDEAYRPRYRKFYDKGRHQLSTAEKVECVYAGWMALLEQWPSPEHATPLESLAGYILSNHRAQGRPAVVSSLAEARWEEIGDTNDPQGETIWVFHNLSNKLVDPLSCPSRGAWELLQHAKKDRKWFYEKIYKPMASETVKQQAKAQEQMDEYKPSKAERLAVEEMKVMLSELKAHGA